jgi:hypothetical protein
MSKKYIPGKVAAKPQAKKDSKIKKSVSATLDKIKKKTAGSASAPASIFDPDIYIPIMPKYYRLIPLNTQIGYTCKSPNGDLINIKSAFIQTHIEDVHGDMFMSVRCGKNTWINPYKSFTAIYIFKRNAEEIHAKIASAKMPDSCANRLETLENAQVKVINLLSPLIRQTSQPLIRSDRHGPHQSAVQIANTNAPAKLQMKARPKSLTHASSDRHSPHQSAAQVASEAKSKPNKASKLVKSIKNLKLG